jgi:putative DNA primase/helicase
LPENLPPVPKFDYRMLPNAFQGWVRDVAERMQIPPDFVAAPLMVAFAAVVGRRVGIRPKRRDDWLVVPNLWGAIVGSPGLLKSPALKEALAPMDVLVARAAERHERALDACCVD